MRKTVRGLAAAAALVIPVAIGWAYTAEASVGENGSGFAGLFSDETVDEFLIDDYLITREGRDGVVTMSVVGPDGAVVAPADVPPDIAEEVSYFESEWSPPDGGAAFEIIDGVACYTVPDDMKPDSSLHMDEDNNSVVRALHAETDSDGNLTAQARQWHVDDLTPQQRDELATGSAQLDDLPNGTDLSACTD